MISKVIQSHGEYGHRWQLLSIGSFDFGISPDVLVMMQDHFEFVKVVPSSGLVMVQIVIEITSRKAETVKLLRRVQEQDCRCFLIAQSWIVT